MMLSYSRPEVKDESPKPPAMAGQGFPYQSISPRRFEELLYSIGKMRLEEGDWRLEFDDIELLQGVRERGRDCVLYRSGKAFGLIQCKHTSVSRRVSLPEMVMEIIKFALYSIESPELISQKNEFTYFFAVAFGFTEQALSLLADFNKLICERQELRNWTEKVIIGNESLKHLEYGIVSTELLDILSQIKVKPIKPQDLNKLLMGKGFEPIIKTFFEIRSVIDPEATSHILEGIDQLRENSGFQLESNLPHDIILKKFEFASNDLANYNNSFEGLQNSHLTRSETDEIVQWVKKAIPFDQKPIAILSGNAGAGKTVVLQDVYNVLKKDAIPVIGLKADRYTCKSISDLEKKIDLKDSLERVIYSLSDHHERIVVIIDQLDALSQSLSARRDYLDTFNLLVRKLCVLPKVRIVISARVYDLNYDSELNFYNNQKIFHLGLLTNEQVINILNRLSVNISTLNDSLVELLRVPHYLNVFCMVYNARCNLTILKTKYDLHEQLWISKILNVPDESKAKKDLCQEFVYTLAGKMHKSQKIIIQDNLLVDQFFDEINYLKSCEIITEEDGQFQFFHQTFYDFVFARHFVSNGESVLKYLKENHQGLFIRSSLKMILQFLRDQDNKKYIQTISAILFHHNYRFHLKLMVINLIGFETDPTLIEKEFVQLKVLKDQLLKRLFIESAYSKIWLIVLIESGELSRLLVRETLWYDGLMKADWKALDTSKEWGKRFIQYRTPEQRTEDNHNLCFEVLRRQLPDSADTVSQFLTSIPDFDGKARFIFNMLYFFKNWSNEQAFLLFEQNEYQGDRDRFGYYKILEDAARFRIDWVLSIYKKRHNTEK